MVHNDLPPSAVATAYDGRAEEYTALLGTLEQQAPEDRELVRRWRGSTRGRLLDAGCGPGHWTRFLQDPGDRPVLGLDLSARFLALARERHPATTFVRGSIGALPVADASLGGVLAWYSLIHTPPAVLPQLVAEVARVLAPTGTVLLGFVDGPPGHPFAHQVTTAWTWSVDTLADLLAPVGLGVVEHHHRRDEGHRPHGALVAARTTEEQAGGRACGA